MLDFDKYNNGVRFRGINSKYLVKKRILDGSALDFKVMVMKLRKPRVIVR